MPLIPFPNVPNYPGVPAIPRTAQNTPPGITMGLGPTQTALASGASSAPQWGIFDVDGNQLGMSTGGSILSTNAFEYSKETRVSDFPVEQGSFAAYNKVETPGNPTVTLAFQGTAIQRSTFLNAIDAACKSISLYNVVTPEVTYANYTIERYNYTRRSDRGVTLLIVELSLKEIRQVSAQYSTVQTPINNPQNPGAEGETSQGTVQPQPPSPSILAGARNAIRGFFGGN